MITIDKESSVVTLINVFTCEPNTQQDLIDTWVRATEATLGKLPGIISASLHRSKDGIRVVNYAQWRYAEGWEALIRAGSKDWFIEMSKFGKPDAHLYEVCYVLDKSAQ